MDFNNAIKQSFPKTYKSRAKIIASPVKKKKKKSPGIYFNEKIIE